MCLQEKYQIQILEFAIGRSASERVSRKYDQAPTRRRDLEIGGCAGG